MDAKELHCLLLDAVGDGFADRAGDLYAQDARVEIPFAHDGSGTVTGSEAVRERFRQVRTAGISVRVHDVRMYSLGDPHVSIAEFAYTWHSSRLPFTTHNIQVVEEHNGLIVHTRDYHDHAAIGAGLRGSAADAVERMQAAFNTRDFDAVDDIFAPDFVSHPLGGAGRDTVRQRWQAMADADPTMRITPRSLVSDTRTAAVHSVAGGESTPVRELFEFVRVEDGRIRELWGAASHRHGADLDVDSRRRRGDGSPGW